MDKRKVRIDIVSVHTSFFAGAFSWLPWDGFPPKKLRISPGILTTRALTAILHQIQFVEARYDH